MNIKRFKIFSAYSVIIFSLNNFICTAYGHAYARKKVNSKQNNSKVLVSKKRLPINFKDTSNVTTKILKAVKKWHKSLLLKILGIPTFVGLVCWRYSKNNFARRYTFGKGKNVVPECHFELYKKNCNLDYKEISIPFQEGGKKFNLIGKELFDNTNNPSKIVIAFAGNSGHCDENIRVYIEFVKKGYKVIAVDYRGYGESKLNGKLLTDKTIRIDVEKICNYVTNDLKIEPNNIILYGHSLGGYAASCALLHFCKNSKKVEKLILHSPINSAYEAAKLVKRKSWRITQIMAGITNVILTSSSLNTIKNLESAITQYGSYIPNKIILFSGKDKDFLSLKKTKIDELLINFLKNRNEIMVDSKMKDTIHKLNITYEENIKGHLLNETEK